MHPLTQLIYHDMKPALGVTEPGAIAFAVAKAKAQIGGTVELVELRLNSGMYKNAFTCGIPGSTQVGNLYAAAWAPPVPMHRRGWNVWTASPMPSTSRHSSWWTRERCGLRCPR